MTAEPPPALSGAAVKGGSAIAASVVVMNISTYAFTIFAAGLLKPHRFGAFAAVMNVLLVAGVLSLALQATAARRIAREPGDVGQVERTILQVGARSALGLGVLLVLLSPVVDATLKLDSLATALLMALAIVPITLMGAQSGVLQGERRWGTLAVVYLSAGLPRLLIGLLLLWWRPSVVVAVAAVAVSAYVPAVVGAIALRRPRSAEQAPHGDHSARALWWETVYNSQALLAFLALSSLDIVIARNTLDGHAAGLYAAGLIMVKAVTFLPQFVVVLAFPSMGTDGAPLRALLISLAMVTLAGLAVTVGVRVLPDLALVFIGGDDYTGVSGRLWIFALLGTVVSLVQLLVYNVLARQARSTVIVIWIGLAALLVAGSTSSTLGELVTRVLITDSALLGVLLVLALARMRASTPVQ